MIPHSRPWITKGDMQEVFRVLDSQQIGAGPLRAKLEEILASWVGGAGGVAVSSGASALELGLRALDCRDSDEVILPTYTCRHLLEAVLNVGAKPVFCDVGPDWLVARDHILRAQTPRTRILILPHLYGRFAPVHMFKDLKLKIIEDFAQAIPRRHSVRLNGEIGVFSLHPTKCITSGEGGVLVTSDLLLLARARNERDGNRRKLRRRQFSLLSDMAAALAISQLQRYENFIEKRLSIAKRYKEASNAWVRIRIPPPSSRKDIPFRFTVHHPDGFKKLAPKFLKKKVVIRKGVDELLHRLVGCSDKPFQQSLVHFEKTISLPIYPSLDKTEIEWIISVANDIFA